MVNVNVDFSKPVGKMKPMHAVNNGPVVSARGSSNTDAFIDAGIPYARTHDAAFYAPYGGEHIVDIHAIFPDFNKDVNDENSYDFTLTDYYLEAINSAKTKVFYRLGSKIEHAPKKYGTLVPPDFQKWAEICEHIIRHYTEGWADGFNYDIEYWEIWNEPDIAPDDFPPENKPCWGGTRQQFCEFYEVAAKHLKKCFPHLKIGGPAVTTCSNKWTRHLMEYFKGHNVPLDFFSWHRYSVDPHEIVEKEKIARDLLNEFGYTETESILNEWNYVCGWVGEDFIKAGKSIKGLKGSSFIAGTVCLSQYQPVDMLMYYDARPCVFNGLFNTDFVTEKLKGYWSLWMFNKLYKLGTAVECSSDNKKIIACAATDDAQKAVMLTYYDDVDEAEPVEIQLNLNACDGQKVKIYVLNKDKNAEFIGERVVKDDTINLTAEIFTTYLIVSGDK